MNHNEEIKSPKTPPMLEPLNSLSNSKSSSASVLSIQKKNQVNKNTFVLSRKKNCFFVGIDILVKFENLGPIKLFFFFETTDFKKIFQASE